MNTKTKASFATVITTIMGIAVMWAWSSQHAAAVGPRGAEQYKVIYVNNTGEDFEATLNKASADGWKFKAALGDKAVLFVK